MRVKFDFRFAGMQQMVGITAVNHVHVMSGLAERVGESVKVNGIPAKAVRRVEGREVKKI